MKIKGFSIFPLFALVFVATLVVLKGREINIRYKDASDYDFSVARQTTLFGDSAHGTATRNFLKTKRFDTKIIIDIYY